MKLNGYRIRDAMREMELKRASLEKIFKASLIRFEGEDKPDPVAIAAEYAEVEAKISLIQAVQSQYNLLVKVRIKGLPGDISLTEAIKRTGGAARVEKLWRELAEPKKARYSSYEEPAQVRDKNLLVAQHMVSTQRAVELATQATRFTAALRSAIAVGNATEVDIDTDPNLFP